MSRIFFVFVFVFVKQMAGRVGALVLSAGLLGCRPDFPMPGDSGGAAALGSAESVGPLLEIEPVAPADAAPPVLRLKVSLGAEMDALVLDIDRIALFEGELGSGHLRQVEQNKISKTLAKRIVPALVFQERDAVVSNSIVLAPTVKLSLGETYTLASGSPLFSMPIHIVKEDPAPTLARIWPPEGKSAGLSYALWCGDKAMPPIELDARLEPFSLDALLAVGALPGAGMHCARLELKEEVPVALVEEGMPLIGIGPPALLLPDALFRLDPRPFGIDGELQGAAPLECELDEVLFGPGCARVLDDRLLVRTPEQDLLWVISAPTIGLDEVRVTAPGDPMIVASLPPQTDIEFKVSTINTAGNKISTDVLLSTGEPMPHVILNEVYANPIGAEPDQEWVEIFNDGPAMARLEGYKLLDIGGESELPSAELLPGEFALIVNESFVEDGELDPLPAPGTLLIRVPRLGKGGLGNSGEPLKLLDGEAQVVSRFGAAPRVKAGQSLSRRFPASADGLASSFVPSAPTPGQANAQVNSL